MADCFLIFLLGHLAGDFLLQTHELVQRKKEGSLAAYLRHGVIHALATAAFAGLFASAYLRAPKFYAVLMALLAVHLAIDWGKIHFTANGALRDNLSTFLGDQALHVLTIAVAAFFYAGESFSEIARTLFALQSHRTDVLSVLGVYIAVVFAGGYAIRYLTRPMLASLPQLVEETREELRNAGMYIGWLERLLVLTAVILRSPATVGLVLTAKSIVRYPEIKSGRFAEYFLIGTLLSILLALMGGVLLLKILYGQVHFAP
ncbi:MAG TPA: DUF3307 domain-containing protein [Candidatus Acidoferrum sp.]|nr:DUF3307 domain-containing protein [Candidatus Acidoferrum sp.]